MNIAVIDLGTNTFNLLIAEVASNDYQAKFATKEFVQLGKGGINNKLIQKDAFIRGLDTLKRFKTISEQHNCSEIICVATSAIRNAKNGVEFTQQVEKDLGLKIQIIDGNKEAELIYLGAKQAVHIEKGFTLIMDVGGGSTEFIICNAQDILWKQSFEVGVARLFERFHHSEPITAEETKAIEQYLDAILAPLITYAESHSFEKLIGCSGAFSSFAAIILNQEDKEDEVTAPQNYRFTHSDFSKTHQLLLGSNLEERLKINGLVKQRAPMIVVGSILVNYILEKLNINHFEMSKYALKEGVVFDFINNK